MKAWANYFKDIGRYFLANKPELSTAEKHLGSDPWRTTRSSAVHDFLHLTDLMKERNLLESELEAYRRIFSERAAEAGKRGYSQVGGTSKTKKAPHIVEEVMKDDKKIIAETKAKVSNLNRTIDQAHVYITEGNKAYHKAMALKSALASLLSQKDKKEFLYANPPDIQILTDEILRLRPALNQTFKGKESLKNYLEMNLPLSETKSLNDLPLYEAPDTVYYMKQSLNKPAANAAHRASTAMESVKATRRGSTAVIASMRAERKEPGGTDTIRRQSTAQAVESSVAIPMPTFANTIGIVNLLRHPVTTLSYALDGLTKVAFEYPAIAICRGVSAAYNGIYRLGGWLANKVRTARNQPEVKYADPDDNAILRRLKVATNSILVLPPVLLGLRTVCLGISKLFGSENGLRDKHLILAAERKLLLEARLQEFDDEQKRRRSTRGSIPFARANSSPNLDNLVDEKDKKETKSVLRQATLPGTTDDEGLDMTSDESKPPFLHQDTITPFTQANSDTAHRHNTFSPRGALEPDSSLIIKHLLLNTEHDDSQNNTPAMTPHGSQQGNLTVRSSQFSLLTARTPTATPHDAPPTRFQSWVADNKDKSSETAALSPQPSPKPARLTSPRHPFTRAKTTGGPNSPAAGSNRVRFDRATTKDIKITRIEESTANGREDHSPSSHSPKK